MTKITDEEMEYIIDMLEFEVEEFEDGTGYVEYEMTQKSCDISKKILEKLKGMMGK